MTLRTYKARGCRRFGWVYQHYINTARYYSRGTFRMCPYCFNVPRSERTDTRR